MVSPPCSRGLIFAAQQRFALPSARVKGRAVSMRFRPGLVEPGQPHPPSQVLFQRTRQCSEPPVGTPRVKLSSTLPEVLTGAESDWGQRSGSGTLVG